MSKAYIPLVVRQAMRAKMALEQAKVDIAKLHEVERLSAKVMAMSDVNTHEGVAPNYDGGSKPIKYSKWRGFLTDTIVTGYVLDSLVDTVQVYCIHCGLPTDASTAKQIAIGVIATYDETVPAFDKVVSEWTEEDLERIRPAIHKGLGCIPCYWAYTKACANAKRLTTRIRYKVDGIFKTLYATDIRHGSSLLQEQMGRVELISCERIPERQGFLNVSAKLKEFTPNPKRMTQEYAQRERAMRSLQALEQRTAAIMAKCLADNQASEKANTRKRIKARLEVFANAAPVKDWTKVAAIVQGEHYQGDRQ